MNIPLSINRNQFFHLFLLIVFLLPTFPTITRSAAGRIGDIFLVVVMVSLIIFYLLVYNPKLVKENTLIALVVFVIFILLISGSIFIELEFIILRDLFEFHKPVFILLVFLFFLSLDWDPNIINQYLIKSLKWIFFINIVFSLIEAYSGSFGNILSTFFYKNDRSILYGKATGTFGITYFFAAFMIIPSFFYLFKYLLERNFRHLLLFLLSFFCILSSQSRTVFLATCFGFLYLFMIYWSLKDFPLKKALYFSTFSIIAVIGVFWGQIMHWASVKFPYLFLGIYKLIENGGVSATGKGSANIRFQQVLWAWENQMEVPLIGVGIGKGSGPLLESFYALYLYRYGFIGIGIAIILLLINYFLSLKCYKISMKNGHLENGCFFLAFSVFCFVLPVSSVASVITDQPKHAVIYYGLMAVMLKYYHHHQKKMENDKNCSSH